MIANNVPGSVLLLDKIRILCNLPTKAEKCSLYMVLLEDSEYLRCIVGIWAIIEGQRNLWQSTIAIEKETILALENC
jgi:hypothetical protein